VADHRAGSDGGGLRCRVCIGGDRTCRIRRGGTGNGTGVAGNRAMVLSPVLARLCWRRDGGAVRAASWRIGASRARTGPRLRLGSIRPCRARPLAVLCHGQTRWNDLFWIGVLCTYLLALFSLPRLHDLLKPRLWRTFRAIALEYIALVFAADFILAPLQAGGLGKYPLTYLPFALMLVAGAGLRVAAFARSLPVPNKIDSRWRI
jgi:hypothetical protein